MDLGIGWVDWAILAVLVVSCAVGAWRGLVFELLALLGWFVAFIAAQSAWPWLADHLPIGTPGSLLNHAVSFACVFLVALILWSVLSRIVRRLVRATPLAPVDRVLGAAFGFLRGWVVLLVVAAVVAYTPAERSADWRASYGAVWLNAALQGLKAWLPSAASNLLRV
jgi:membrane protein required for colicin V production